MSKDSYQILNVACKCGDKNIQALMKDLGELRGGIDEYKIL